MFQVIREPEFAKRVVACREKIGLKQSQCADLTGVSRQHWNNWETGYCKPKGKRLRTVAAVLQCDPLWLQHGERTEIEQRIGNVMYMMRAVIRDLGHINDALRKTK